MNGRAKGNNLSIIFGGISVLIQASVLLASGSPFDFAHKVGGYNLIPPLWTWCLTLLIVSFSAGFAFGNILNVLFSGGVSREKEAKIYQGSVFFIASLILSFIQYPLLFVEERLVLSLIIAVVAFALYCICAIMWSRSNIISCIMVSICAIWMAYVSLVNGYLIFCL